MTTTRCARAGLFVGLVLACGARLASAQDVTYNAMPATDFSKFKTYKWVQVEGAVHPDQIVDAQITVAIDGQLASKGLTKSSDDKADLYVDYQVAVNQEKQWNAYGGGLGFRMGGGMANATSSTINIGTLGIDMYDPRRQPEAPEAAAEHREGRDEAAEELSAAREVRTRSAAR
jgi:Domain of unknown function (DUF4136)